MKQRPELVAAIKKGEGLVLSAYKDSLGYLTIGYGRLIDGKKGGGITEAEAEYLLLNDISNVCASVDKALPWIAKLNPVRQNVLYEMAFNMGVMGLLKWKNTLKMIECGQFKEAADAMRGSLWAKQVKSRAVRLALEMETGKSA